MQQYLPLLVALFSAGCALVGDCEDVSRCDDELTIALERRVDAEGAYTLAISGDSSFACEFSIGPEGLDPGTCTEVLFSETEDALDTFTVPAGPGELVLDLARDGEALVHAELEPSWSRSFPGGPMCRNACQLGLVLVPLDG